MATVSVSQATGFDIRDFWIENSADSANEHFETLTDSSQTATSRDDSYSEFAFDSNGYKYNYVGEWDLHAQNDLLAAQGTVSASGTYHSIVLENAGVQAVNVTGLSFDVDFGTHSGLPLINLNSQLNDTVSSILFGAGSDPDQAFQNLHYGATPHLAALAFAGDDRMYGNDGDDTLTGYGGNDVLWGYKGADSLFGLAGDDTLSGGPGNDILRGNGGADHLIGGYGDDLLRGGLGNDVLAGGAGQDRLSGSLGNDTFDFNFINESSNHSPDIILDFTHGEDLIDLSDIDANVNAAGNQAFTFIGAATFSGHAGELHFILQGNTALIRGDANGDGVGDFTIIASHAGAFGSADFLL